MKKLIPFLFFLIIFGCKSEEERIIEKANDIEKESLFAKGQVERETALARQYLELSNMARLNKNTEMADYLLSKGTIHLSNSNIWIGKIDSLINEYRMLLKEAEQLE